MLPSSKKNIKVKAKKYQESYISNVMTGTKLPRTELSPMEDQVFRMCNISPETVMVAAENGKEMLAEIKTKNNAVKIAIINSWIEVNHLDSTQRKGTNDEFKSVVSLAKDFISIQENYEARWRGLKTNLLFFKESQKSKAGIVNEINNKLVDLINQYPKKNRQKIVSEMKTFLMGQTTVDILKNSALSTQIHRVISKLETEEQRELKKQTPTSNIVPENKNKPEVLEEKKSWIGNPVRKG